MMDLELPAELTGEPLALVSFAGLNTEQNAVHADLFRRFVTAAANSLDVPLQLQRVDEEKVQWPDMKPKRNSYDWFIPKGILKRNWMNKHLSLLPAVVVVFADLDWSQADFNQKKAECADRVKAVRASLSGRGTKIAVVLIQHQESSALPLVGEDASASERAAALCAACELSNRSLFALPVQNKDSLDGYILRLESAFYELAQNYYHQEIRSVKSHRDYLNKTTHLYLFVRHQFKIGFLNELKRDFHAAYKHYGQAYSLLMEVRATDTNIMEVKTVAGFISYKICKLAFRVNLPRDAISQFRKHMDIFQQKVGMDVLAFEHKGWQSKQSEFFADVFTEAIENGLPAIQTQHPGLYYQQAAQYAVSRREISEEADSSSDGPYPDPDPLSNANSLEFFGQRPWRPGKVSLEPPDMELETLGVKALLHREREGRDKRGEDIVRLLQGAIAQFRKFRSPRSESHLTVTMAEELKNAKRYREALDLLGPVMSHYRRERWRPLLDAVLALGIKCSFLLCDVASYVGLCLDLASVDASVSSQEKSRVAANVVKVLNGSSPDAEPGMNSKVESDVVKEALKLWDDATKKSECVKVDMTGMTSAVRLNVNFKSKEIRADDKVTAELKISNELGGAFSVLGARVTLSNASHKLKWNGNESLSANSALVRSFEFRPEMGDVGGRLRVTDMSVVIGKEEGGVRMELTSSVQETRDKLLRNFIIPKSKLNSDAVDGEVTAAEAFTEVLQREPLLNVVLEHSGPALVGEWFPVHVVMTNGETDGEAIGTEVSAVLDEAFDPIIADTTTLTLDPKTAKTLSSSSSVTTPGPAEESQPLVKQVGNIPIDQETKCRMYIKSSTTGRRGIRFKVTYAIKTADSIECKSSISQFMDLQVLEPFSLETNLMSRRLKTITQVHTDEEFLLSPKLTSLTPHSLTVMDSWLEPRPPLKLHGPSKHASQIKNCSLGQDYEARECIAVSVKRSDLLSPLDIQEISMGKYMVRWRREEMREGDEGTVTTFELSVVRVKVSGLQAKAFLPPHGVVRTPMTVRYLLGNLTERAMEFTVTMEPSESFMLSGNKQTQARIPPSGQRSMTYVLYPLVAGSDVELPRLRLAPARISQSAQEPEAVLERALPRTVTVLPRPRGSATAAGKDEVDAGKEEVYVLGEHIVMDNPPYPTSVRIKALRQ